MSGYLGDFVAINGLPFLACLTVSGVLVYLGMHVVERKVIFVDLALAQIAAFGVMWAILMGYSHEEDTLAVALFSLAFTIMGAAIFSITRTSNKRVPHEALIGIVYVTATAAGLVLADRFALGTEALKELIAGRVALITSDTLGQLVVTCVAVAIFHTILYRKFVRISTDPEEAEKEGINLRLWDFLFYVSFGVLITQAVTVLGVLPVFAYLVIPAVAGAFLFERIRSRLIFGWIFSALGSLLGLESARHLGLDPGPTIVCLFSAALVLLGIALFIRARGLSLATLARAGGFTALFGLFFLGTLLFRKPVETDEMRLALQYAGSDDTSQLRQAMESFPKFPERKPEWLPMVIDMLNHPDHIVREDAVAFLGKLGDGAAVPKLVSRLGAGTEPDDVVREQVVTALRAIGDPSAVKALVAAAAKEVEADIAVEMCEAAFELGEATHMPSLQIAADILVDLIDEQDAPRGARRDAEEHLRNHVALYAGSTEELVQWWRSNRDSLVWRGSDKRFVLATEASDVTPSE